MAKELINNIRRGSLANVIALHDFMDNEINLKQWFEYTVELFHKNGLIPNKAALGGVNGTKGNKNVLFNNAQKRLYECDFKGIDDIWFTALPPEYSLEMSDGLLTVSVTIDARSTFRIIFDDQIMPFQKEIMKNLTKDFLNLINAQYGYAYQRLYKLGPEFYPFGIICGLDWDKDRKERELITKWSHKFRMPDGSYKTGDLRDIYPMNLLVDEHLNRIVINNQTLEAWIKSDKSHGELEELTPGKFAWWVEQENISMVRDALRPSGIIIAG